MTLRQWVDHFGLQPCASPALALAITAQKKLPKNEDTRYWFDRASTSLALLQKLQSIEDAGSFARHKLPPAFMAEWGADCALTSLAEALPHLQQVLAMYLERQTAFDAAQTDLKKAGERLASLEGSLKEETCRKERYRAKLRELQQKELIRIKLGSNPPPTEVGELGLEADSLIYTEADMEQRRKEWEERMQTALEAERLGAASELKHFRLEMEEALRALRQELDERSAAQLELEKALQEALAAKADQEAACAEAMQQLAALQEENQDLCRRAELAEADAAEQQLRTAREQQQRRGSAISVGESVASDVTTAPSRPVSAVSRRFDGTGEATQEGAPRGLHRAESLSLFDRRRRAEELKRKVFEEVLEEERRRQAWAAEQEEEDLILKLQGRGFGELIFIVRQVDDIKIRQKIFAGLQGYWKRTVEAMEVVCTFCRRKVTKDKIFTRDFTRPASAAGRFSASGSLKTATTMAFPDELARTQDLSPLTRVISSPEPLVKPPCVSEWTGPPHGIFGATHLPALDMKLELPDALGAARQARDRPPETRRPSYPSPRPVSTVPEAGRGTEPSAGPLRELKGSRW